jgi:hypothetical protein
VRLALSSRLPGVPPPPRLRQNELAAAAADITAAGLGRLQFLASKMKDKMHFLLVVSTCQMQLHYLVL